MKFVARCNCSLPPHVQRRFFDLSQEVCAQLIGKILTKLQQLFKLHTLHPEIERTLQLMGPEFSLIIAVRIATTAPREFPGIMACAAQAEALQKQLEEARARGRSSMTGSGAAENPIPVPGIQVRMS